MAEQTPFPWHGSVSFVRRIPVMGVAALVACLLNVSCMPSKPDAPISAARGSSNPRWITFEVQEVTILENPSGVIDGEAEFQLYIVGSDGISAFQTTYPADNYVHVSAGQSIPLGKYALSVDERSIGDRFVVYILAVDLDDRSVASSQPIQQVGKLLASALVGLLTDGVSVGMQITVAALADMGYEALIDWLEDADLIGEYTVVLERADGWGSGQSTTVVTQNGNLEIKYQVYLENEPRTSIIVVTATPQKQTLGSGSETSEMNCVITTQSVNMRVGPGTEFDAVGFLLEDVIIEVLERKNQEWLRIRQPYEFRYYPELWIWEGATRPISC